MHQNRRELKPWPPKSILPSSQPPLPDPPYEIIEFPSQQQYSNTVMTKGASNEKFVTRKCDLCGSSSAKFHCNMCIQQTFCSSCDLMYHRHPKRQSHIRQRIPSTIQNQPPLPPKGESNTAPIPPPRRNKRSGKPAIAPFKPPQHSTLKKDGSFMGSLKRLVGGMHSPSSQALGKEIHPKTPQFARPSDFEQQVCHRDNGYLDWDSDSRHRSGSFTAFNAPAFAPLIQAQSLAQLNCPSCYSRGMSAMEWNRSQMNLNAFPPWPGGAYTPTPSWHSHTSFQPTHRLPPNDFSRRGSLNQRLVRRNQQFSSDEDEIGSDFFVNGDQKSRGLSPALPRRNQRNLNSDTEDENSSRKSDRRFKKRSITTVSREPSPALSRRSYRKKYDDEDDAVSIKSVSSRRSGRSSSNRSFFRRNIRPNLSDSDDELTSDRETNGVSMVLESKPPTARPSNKYLDKSSESPKSHQAFVKPQIVEREENVLASIPARNDGEDWECEHCTYLNVKSSKVCDVCCKSRFLKTSEPSDTAVGVVLGESMKNMTVSSPDDKKKGGDEETHKIIESTETSPSLPNTSTQDGILKQDEPNLSDDCSKTDPKKESLSDNSQFVDENGKSPHKKEKQDSNGNHRETNAMFRTQLKRGLEIVKLLKEAEKYQYTAEDLNAALAQCGDANPIQWLLQNWNKLIESVVTLASNYGREQPENTIGTISSTEAATALQIHSGDLWAAATECIRQRQKKYDQLISRGNFSREDVVTVLTANHGDLEAAYLELNRAQLKPFLMRIWGPPQGLDNDSGDTLMLENEDVNSPTREALTYNNSQLSKNHHSIENYENSSAESYPDVKLSKAIGFHRFSSLPASSDINGEDVLTNLDEVIRPKDCENGKQGSNSSSPSSAHYVSAQGGHSPQREDDSEMNDEELNVNIYDYLIGEYLKLKIEEDQYSSLQYSDDTDDDSISDLPLDSRVSDETQDKNSKEMKTDFEQSLADFIEWKETVQWAESSSQESLEQHENQMQSDTGSSKIELKIHDQMEKNTKTLEENRFDHSVKNDVEDEQLKFLNWNGKQNDITTQFMQESNKAQSVVNPLFIELKALSLLAELNLDTFVIGMKDTVDQNASIVKTWINTFTSVGGEKEQTASQLTRFETPASRVSSLKIMQGQKKDEVPEKLTEENDERSEPTEDYKTVEEISLVQASVEDKQDGILSTGEDAHPKGEEISSSHATMENDLMRNSFLQKEKSIKMNANPLSRISIPSADDTIQNVIKRKDAIDSKIAVSDRSVPNTNILPRDFIRMNVDDQIIDTIKLMHDLTRPQQQEIQPEVGNQNRLNTEDQSQNLPQNVHEWNLRRNNLNEFGEASVVDGAKVTDSAILTNEIIDSTNGNQHSTGGVRNTNKVENEDKSHEELDKFDRQREPIILKDGNIHRADDITTDRKPMALEQIRLREFNDDSHRVQIQAQQYLSEGLVSTYSQAEVALQLMELKFDRSQSIEAATECSDLYAALVYLRQECQLCAEKFSMKEMVSLLECEHQCCRDCAKQYYTLQIKENNVDDCVCPFCKKPELQNLDSDALLNYFSNLDILLKSIVEPQTHELFQQKLRDRTLMQDPNFKWCAKCSFGFITDPDDKRLSCPSCKSLTCGRCGNLWSYEHEGRTCNQYKQWLEKQNDSSHRLSSYIENYGITCPKCDTKFILVKGGCMHLTCSRCKYEFCSDCQKPFSLGNKCGVSIYCAKLGLHAHHPRNCLFYLRDKEPLELKQLLLKNNVEVNLPVSDNQKCTIQLQKETEQGLVDIQCGAQVEEGGLCKCHLKELFSRRICQNRLETIELLDLDDLETLVMREGIKRPPRGYDTPQDVYYKALQQVLKKIYTNPHTHHPITRHHRSTHYTEHLANLVRKNKIDPVTIFDLAEILQEFRRRGKSLPVRPVNVFEHEYRSQCIQIVKRELPLE